MNDIAYYGTAYAAKINTSDKKQWRDIKMDWKNIVFTAGHNLEISCERKEAKNVCFVPAMWSDGTAPFGMFDAIDGGPEKGYVVCQNYIGDVDNKYDFGAVRLKKCNGKDLGDIPEIELLEVVYEQSYYTQETRFTCIGYSDVGKYGRIHRKRRQRQ